MENASDKVKVSVIVPVYKAEEKLRRCVDSILAQTLDEIEIILVDDGSPDNSASICDEYAEAHANITVIHQQNTGVSGARNAGIQAARGEFIGFVDSDDAVTAGMFEKMYSLAVSENADSVGCGYFKINEKGERLECRANLNSGVYGKEDAKTLLIARMFGDDEVVWPKEVVGYVWMNIYRTAVIHENSVRFYDQEEYDNEDELFVLDFCSCAERIAVINEPLYNYYYNSQSITHSYKKNVLEMKKKLCGRFQEIACRTDLLEEYNKRIVSTKYDAVLTAVYNECRRGCPNSFSGSLKIIRSVCNDDFVINVVGCKEKRTCRSIDRFCIWLVRRKAALFACVFFKIYFKYRSLRASVGRRLKKCR